MLEVEPHLYAEAFEHFPHGGLVLGADGRVLAANTRARALLGEIPEDATCCALFGCRTDASPLGDHCFHELASSRSGPLPEVRVDLHLGREEGALWVVASRVAPSSDHVVVQLRPGVTGDRRRRTEPHWIDGPSLRIFTLGRTHVESSEGTLDGRWLERRPGQILKYLVTERGRVVHTEEIAENIWPGHDLEASGKVRYFIHALRTKVEPARKKRAPSAFVMSKQGGYALDTERVWIDADEFERRLARARRALGDGDIDRARVAFSQALELYGGDFLADEPYTQWTLRERDRLRALASDALRALANMRLCSDERHEAFDLLQRLADMEPYDTEVQRKLIALDLARGRGSDAVRRYGALRQRMVETFSEEPPFTLKDVDRDEVGPLADVGAALS